MTPKQIFKVNLMEIPHIEITCTLCGAAMVFPVPLPKNINIKNGISCVACSEPLCKSQDDKALGYFANVLTALGDWKRLEEQRFTLSFSLTQKESQ